MNINERVPCFQGQLTVDQDVISKHLAVDYMYPPPNNTLKLFICHLMKQCTLPYTMRGAYSKDLHDKLCICIIPWLNQYVFTVPRVF